VRSPATHADFDRSCRFPAAPQPFVHDLPGGPAGRAVRDMHNSLAAPAALIALVSAAQLGELPLAAVAILLLGMALNEIHRGDR
jgi:hypothetical protein